MIIKNIANDPNILFVVEHIHDNYRNQQAIWTDTNDTLPIHNIVGQEQVQF